MKRSETADNFLGGTSNNGLSLVGTNSTANSPRIARHIPSSPYMEPRRRPISQFISHDVKSSSDLSHIQKSPLKKITQGTQLNPYPPPSAPAPPPPLRTVSKTVDPIGLVQ